MTYVFQESLRFTSSYESPDRRGFPLAVALKKFWLCFAPRYDPLLWSGQEGKVDPYARAPTQHLFQEDRFDVDEETGIPFTYVSTSCIPSIAEFVSSFPFIKNLRLTLKSHFDSSLAPLSQMRLLTHLCLIFTLDGVTPKHLSEIVNVSVKNLHLRDFNGDNLSSLFPQQEQQQGGRLQRTLRRLTLRNCYQLTDLSALAGFETLLELKLDSCSCLTDLSSISKLKELRVVRVEQSRNLEMNSFVNAVTRLEFLLELEISFCDILDEHIRKIATIETLEKLELTECPLAASSESLSMLLDPQNLPNLRELELIGPTSSPFKHCAGSGPCVNLEKLRVNFDTVKPHATDISIFSKKFPNLQCLFLDDFQDGTDFSPLGDLTCLTELTLNNYEFTSIQSASLESAIPKLVNLKNLDLDEFPDADVKNMLVPLRKLEVLLCYSELTSTMNTILDLIEEEGHLPVFFRLGSQERKPSGYPNMKEEFIPELLEQRRKQRIEENKFRSRILETVQREFISKLLEKRRKLQIEVEHLQQQSKKEQQERQAERRERDQEEEESETDNTVKKKKRKKK